jgi:putative membrane protein
MRLNPRLVFFTALAALLALVALPAMARSDAAFMKQAAENGHAEVEASKLAQQKAKRPDVKAFADTMVTDHTKVDGELKQLAASKKVELPTGPSAKQKSELKAVDTGDNAKFDERYTKAFGVKAHEDTIKLFQEAAKSATDADVKAFAQKTLPSLQHHLEMAKALDKSAGAGK